MIGCIIQARVNSTRFPKKILQNLDKEDRVLEYVINQVKNSKKINQIIIATTSLKDDDIVIDISEKNLVNSYSQVRDEMAKYSSELLKKQEIIVFNKTDLVDEEEKNKKIKEFDEIIKKSTFTTSTLDKKSVSDIKSTLLNYVS